MSSPLPFLQLVLEDLPAVSSMAGLGVPVERRALGGLHSSDGKGACTVEACEPVRFSAPTSSSNGETLPRTGNSRGNITADLSGRRGPKELERQQCDVRASIEGSALLEQPALRAMAHEENVAATPAPGRVHSEEDDGSATGSSATLLLQGVWPHYVYVQPTSTGRGDSVAVLSDAAALMIAHAVHRSSLLQHCFTQWQVQQARHAQWRLHREYFAEGYYQRNLLYLFFRAWQWRHNQRIKRAGRRQALERLRARHLRHQVLVAWRQWKSERRSLQRRVNEIQTRSETTLTRRYFEQWRRTSTHQALARTTAQLSVDSLRGARFRCWRRFVLHRRRRWMLAEVLATYTPSAWTTAQRSSFDVLHRRYVWIQWLRVTMQRRACRLQRYERALSTVMVRVEQLLRRRRYVTWLRVTCASLHLRQAQRGLIQRYYNSWTLLGRLGHTRLQWERDTRIPHKKRQGLAQWHRRLGGRRTSRTHMQTAVLFFESVMQPHVVRAAFHFWCARYTNRARAQRMRRVAEGYARPALLRHLFLRHVTDSILASPSGLESALEPKRRCGGADPTSPQPTGSAGASNDKRTLEAVTKMPGSSSQYLRQPIPLHHHSATSRASGVPAARPDAPRMADVRSNRAVRPDTTGAVAVSCPEQAVDMGALLPPPPSYEEAMRSSRATDTGGRIRGCALPVRADVGVGTTCEASTSVPCATPRISSGGKHSASSADVGRQREEAAPPLVATVPDGGALSAGAPAGWPAAVPCCAVPSGPPISWALGFVPTTSAWPTRDTPAPSSASVTPLTSAMPASRCVCRFALLTPSDAVPAAAELPACASCSQACREGGAGAAGLACRPRNPAAPPSAAPLLPSTGLFRAPPSPRTHCGFDIHRHVDPLAPLTPSPSRAACPGDPSWVELLHERERQRHTTRRRRFQPPAVNLGNTILSRGRVPLSFLGRRPGNGKAAALLSRERNEGRGTPSVSSAPPSSLPASSSPSSASAVPEASDVASFPLCLTTSTTDLATLRAQARDVLDDYKCRTRLVAAEKVELAAIESQLALARRTEGVARKTELSKRRRCLQRRLLEWEQRRAQVVQLTMWLEGRVSAATSAAASQAGGGEL
ncbi:hypothetical protein LSCM1_01410 [Leishmania martiniquensis]|uniref:Sfi1 spindle body domain-containing protein n=1 Tax=Leishmania martiniquensis TaxID=1580590 RepID=A0A836GT17_9TRYP|nr:hypothetical protein LSCM1_01410 [Leishmania martiniquensis]